MPSNREEGKVCLVFALSCDKQGNNTLPSFLLQRMEVAQILERNFQKRLIKRLHEEMPDAIVLKTDPSYIQGIPDLLILKGKRWAALEVKREEHAPHRPNQDFYIQKMNGMSFARFIYPENEEEILHGIRKALGASGTTRVPKPEQS